MVDLLIVEPEIVRQSPHDPDLLHGQAAADDAHGLFRGFWHDGELALLHDGLGFVGHFWSAVAELAPRRRVRLLPGLAQEDGWVRLRNGREVCCYGGLGRRASGAGKSSGTEKF